MSINNNRLAQLALSVEYAVDLGQLHRTAFCINQNLGLRP